MKKSIIVASGLLLLSLGLTSSAQTVQVPKHLRGPANAVVTLVEYGDFLDIATIRQDAVIDQLLEAYPTQLNFEFRNFPVERLHLRARVVANATECAHEQGIFWPYYDRLIDAQTRNLTSDDLKRYARLVEVADRDAFDGCVNTGRHDAIINASIEEGTSRGVTLTPTLYIGQTKYEGEQTFETLKANIDAQLAVAPPPAPPPVPAPTPAPPAPAPSPEPSPVPPPPAPAPSTYVPSDFEREVVTMERAASVTTDAALVSRLRGRILLQVEQYGQAWYLNPVDSLRYYLRNGQTAFEALRRFGLGITNANLAKIPVGVDSRVIMSDADSDGLDDKLEDGLGTDSSKADTDGDGVTDGNEVKAGTNPLGAGTITSDSTLVNRLRGRILLQVESHGEAWYVSPVDGKRYYMNNGELAYQLMRYLSLGISNSDIRKIGVGSL